jgi:ABC-2 type transport system ATP-binding protein
MIHVSRLTKYYGDYPAILDISFDVPAGQIVGFLGPNGAGKSTTMRILTGYLTATSGKASIAGFDVFWDSVEVRRRIGYMAESCPLYQEMRVNEYLHYRAGIKGLSGRRRRQRLDFVIKRCWLGDVPRQITGTLSKGYRQRVGLADALLTSPPVLILDEPTAGLDPAQIRSTRALIRELGQEHTILLSTHILSEVEMTCDNVIIINRGRVAAAGSLADLARQAGEKASLVAVFDSPVNADECRALPGLTSVSDDGDSRLRFAAHDLGIFTPRLCALAVEKGWHLRELRPEKPTLEDLFVQITGQKA